MFDRPKSKAIRKGINMLLNGRYGEVQELDLNSTGQSLELQIQLNGETELIDVSIGKYEVDDRDPDAPVIVLRQVKVSRAWMQELATDNVEGKVIAIPPKLAGLVKMVL